jgi:hypothetical protein
MTVLALVPSPFLGAASWAPAQAVLARRGSHALVLGLPDPLDGTPGAYRRIGRALAAQIDEKVVLVLHSGAGALAPSIAAAAGGRALASVLVDALHPHPGLCWFDTVPPAMAESLRAAATGGCAPPWTAWIPQR